jgi:hypothetical protein
MPLNDWLRTDLRPEFHFRQQQKFFSWSPHPGRLWAQPVSSPMGIFSRGQSGRTFEMTSHHHLVPRSRMRGSLPLCHLYVLRGEVLEHTWFHKYRLTVQRRTYDEVLWTSNGYWAQLAKWEDYYRISKAGLVCVAIHYSVRRKWIQFIVCCT